MELASAHAAAHVTVNPYAQAGYSSDLVRWRATLRAALSVALVIGCACETVHAWLVACTLLQCIHETLGRRSCSSVPRTLNKF